jgi:hypothetical protein
MGEFEFALVFFQRGAAIRRDIIEFRDGITKCRSAILDSISGVKAFEANPNFAVSRPREPLVPIPPEAREPRQEEPEHRQKIASLLPEKVEPLSAVVHAKEFLGELALDYEYLLELREEVTRSEDDSGKREDTHIAGVVDDALAFLEQRGAFWSQQGGGERQDEIGDEERRTRSGFTSPERAARSKTAHHEMSKIQQYEAKYGQGEGKWKSGKESRSAAESVQ